MILKVIIILIVVGILAVIINGVFDYKEQASNKISFSKAMKTLSLPIITLFVNDKPYNFIVDTGANYSLINTNALKELEHYLIKDIQGTTYDVSGQVHTVSYARINLTHCNTKFVDEFQVMDISNVINNLKMSDGVEIVGIIGSSFLKRYNFIVDFAELNTYPKYKE